MYKIAFIFFTGLSDADERMKRLHSQSKESKLYKKLLIIVPKLFVKEQLKVLEQNENGQKIAGFEALKPVFNDEIVSGMEIRKYQLIPYKVEEKTNPLIKVDVFNVTVSLHFYIHAFAVRVQFPLCIVAAVKNSLRANKSVLLFVYIR